MALHSARSVFRFLCIMAAVFAAGCASDGNRLPADMQELPPGMQLSQEERQLYGLVNEYRNKRGLPYIPLSPSLTYVAQKHARDLHDYPPKGKCNMHSWSRNGAWSSCCYTPDHAAAKCMWDKPRELTSYQGTGYEISFGCSGGLADAESALKGWKGSKPHNAVIINKGMWRDNHWKSLGVGIYRGYAVAWFGEEADTPSP